MNSFIKYHSKKYPLMKTQDIVKLIYQSCFGPGHFIPNLEFVKKYYDNEINNMESINNENLYEHIGNNFARINIKLYNDYFKDNKIIEYFYNSSLQDCNNQNSINQFKNELLNINNDGFLDAYNFENVHHSNIYNKQYKPHYRVINTSFISLEMKVKQLQNFIDSFNDFTIFALEGKCGSGKTTICNFLKDVTIIDVDDFFLKKELKTKERLNEIGGNIDYELYEQCLKKIKPNTTITYKVFDCQNQRYYEKTIKIGNKVLLVGVYSYHQNVRTYINKLCYLLVSDDVQLKRIKNRKEYNCFISEWIPLENIYYKSFDFIGEADIII